jgi:hypothetical protein
MNTPTPRTDAQAGWAIANQYGQSAGSELLGARDGVFVHAVFARTLERELHESRNAERLARVQLGNEREKVQRLVEINEFVGSAQLKAEREKVRALRLACERLRDCDWVISLPDRMDAVRDIARAALAATEDAQ